MLNIKHLTILGLISVITSSNIFGGDKTRPDVPKLTIAIDIFEKDSKSDIDAFPPISRNDSLSSPTGAAISTAAIREVASPVMATVIPNSTPLPAIPADK
jgi:hypothetical protein